jgi:hypothetical protein
VKLLLSAALVALASTNTIAAPATGTWQYEDANVSMRIRLWEDGTCRVSAKLASGPSVGALCTYIVYGRHLVLAWPGIPVNGYAKPSPLRLEFDHEAETLVVEGERERALTRSVLERR